MLSSCIVGQNSRPETSLGKQTSQASSNLTQESQSHSTQPLQSPYCVSCFQPTRPSRRPSLFWEASDDLRNHLEQESGVLVPIDPVAVLGAAAIAVAVGFAIEDTFENEDPGFLLVVVLSCCRGSR